MRNFPNFVLTMGIQRSVYFILNQTRNSVDSPDQLFFRLAYYLHYFAAQNNSGLIFIKLRLSGFDK